VARKRKRKMFDDFARHEVYDRASVVLDLFCGSVAEHPLVAGDRTLSAEAEKATEALYQFYNIAAQKLMPSVKPRLARTRSDRLAKPKR